MLKWNLLVNTANTTPAIFFYLNAKIKNIGEYYSNLKNLEDDEQPYTKAWKQYEIKRVMDSYSRKKKGKKGHSNQETNNGNGINKVYIF